MFEVEGEEQFDVNEGNMKMLASLKPTELG